MYEAQGCSLWPTHKKPDERILNEQPEKQRGKACPGDSAANYTTNEVTWFNRVSVSALLGTDTATPFPLLL
jgi:hypothetical protein